MARPLRFIPDNPLVEPSFATAGRLHRAAAAGEQCGNQEQACQPGLYCAFSMPFDICVPLGKEGEGCGEVWGCAAGLICTAADPTSNVGVCRRVAAKGEPCQAVNQCGGFLASSITCDMSLQVCVDNTSDGPCFAGKPAACGCNPFTSYCDGSTLTYKPISAIGDSCTVNGTQTVDSHYKRRFSFTESHRRRGYPLRRKAHYRPAGLRFGRTGMAPVGRIL